MTDIEDNIERSKSVLALVQDQFTATDRQKLSGEFQKSRQCQKGIISNVLNRRKHQ